MKPEEQDEVYDEDPEGGGLAICIPTEPEVDVEWLHAIEYRHL